MHSWIQNIITADKQLLLFLNGLHTPFLDNLMWIVSSKWFWIPVYLMILYLIIYLYRKQTYKIILIIALSIFLSDIVASHIIKPAAQRLRPTHNTEIRNKLHLHAEGNGTYYYGGRYGFVSSHAANIFTLITLLFYFLKPFVRHYYVMLTSFILFAILICYSRIYLGVHYPLDILGGILVGVAISLSGIYYNRKTSWVQMPQRFLPNTI